MIDPSRYLIKHIPLLFALAAALFFASCKTKQKARRSYVADKTPEFLLEKLKENQFQFEWLSGKISADVTADNKTNSLKANIRIRRDSLIWITINPFGIEMARVLISIDSVKFMNVIDKTYFEGDFNYISQLINAEVDFNLLQSLLVGNPTEEFKAPEFGMFVDKDRYLLSTIKKRRLKRALNRQEKIERLERRDRLDKIEKIEQHEAAQLQQFLQDTSNLVVQSIWLEPVSHKISRYRIHDFDQGRLLEINYSNFIPLDSLLFPQNINIAVDGEKEIRVELQYNKISHSEPLTFPYRVPNKYEKIR